MDNSLSSTNPDLSKEWHPIKNGDRTPENVSHGSQFKAWWICSKCGYEWQSAVKSRAANGRGCPVCSNRVVWKGHNDLETVNPKLASEWHPIKNDSLKPSDVVSGSNRKVWWLCSECGHEWQAVIASRSSGIGCPICSIKKIGIKKTIPKGGNSLLETNPSLAAEWHPTQNGNLNPKDITFKSHRKVWWLCPKCGYDWEMSPHERGNNGCPVCANKAVWPGHNDLATVNPELASEWHPTKNGTLRACDVTPKSGKTVWWLGKCGHEWQAQIGSRANGNGCRICYSADKTSFGERAIYYYLCKSLGKDEVDPNYRPKGWGGLELDNYIEQYRVAIEYDGPFHSRPSQTERDRRKNVLCKEHGIELIRIRYPNLPDLKDCISFNLKDVSNTSIEAAIDFVFRTVQSHDPELQMPEVDLEKDRPAILVEKEKVTRQKSLSSLRPELLAEWNYEKNGNLTPDKIRFKSGYKVWWKCGKCGYEWQATPSDRSDGHGCPFCGTNALWPGHNDLQTLNPKLAKEWHPSKNNGLTPVDVTEFSNHKVWWKCNKCGYEWRATVSSRSAGNNCPACSNRRVWPGHNDLATINPQFLQEWHPSKNKGVLPQDLTPGSNRKVWWLCSKCGYEWQTSIKERSHGKNCPVCANKRIWKGHNDLATINPVLAREWHPSLNEGKLPDDVIPGSNYKAWWLCSKCGYEWRAAVYNRSSGSGCPVCYKNNIRRNH